MATKLFSMARRDKNGSCCRTLLSALVGTYVALGLIVATGFAFYMTLFMCPGLLRHLLQDVIQCEDFPRYYGYGPSPNSSAAEIVEYNKHTYRRGDAPGSMNSKAGTTELEEVPSSRKVRVLVGVFIMQWNVNQRNLLRLAYGMQTSEDADVTLRFIMGGFELATWLEKENTTHGDLMVLKCRENLDEGKTFTYFSSLPTMAIGGEYDYVMKTDDDSYIRVANLGKHLKPLPRTDLYYGYNLPCGTDDPFSGWMAGAGYLVSWDLVLWIRNSPIPRNNSVGTEDLLVRDWFNEGGVAKNRATSRGLFYDYIESKAGHPACISELKLDSILVHKLKTTEQWHSVLAFFLKDQKPISFRK